MKISREEVMRVAQLANLELSEAETETYRAQLDAILEYIDKLNRLDVENVEPMAQVLIRTSGAAGAGSRTDAGGGAEATKGGADVTSGGAVTKRGPEELDDSGTREDVLRPWNVRDAILEQAPEAKSPYFRVPKVIER